MWHGVPFACQRRPIVGVLRMCWLLPGSFDCFCCPHTSVHRPSTACLAVFLCGPGALFLHVLSRPSTICPPPTPPRNGTGTLRSDTHGTAGQSRRPPCHSLCVGAPASPAPPHMHEPRSARHTCGGDMGVQSLFPQGGRPVGDVQGDHFRGVPVPHPPGAQPRGPIGRLPPIHEHKPLPWGVRLRGLSPAAAGNRRRGGRGGGLRCRGRGLRCRGGGLRCRRSSGGLRWGSGGPRDSDGPALEMVQGVSTGGPQHRPAQRSGTCGRRGMRGPGRTAAHVFGSDVPRSACQGLRPSCAGLPCAAVTRSPNPSPPTPTHRPPRQQG